jgi:hypothetical protein
MSSSRQGFYSRIRIGPRGLRRMINLWPPFLVLGVHVERISDDWREVDVCLRLWFGNKNYVGSHFGGSLFAMVDPFYMIMLMQLLGSDYLVWDKAATIRFRKPGRGTVYARFRVYDAMLTAIRTCTAGGARYEPVYTVDIVDEAGEVVAEVEKTMYIRRRGEKPAPVA